jgi:DNA-damage-inducible protein D
MLTTIDQKNIIQSPFVSIKRYDQNRVEFWSARDLMKLLGYAKYERFQNAINKAKVSCSNAGEPIEKHFPASGNLVTRAQGGGSVRENYNLSRYACYLIAQNGDPRKEQIASAQKYFAVKAREAEIIIPKALEEIEVLKLRVKFSNDGARKGDRRTKITRHSPLPNYCVAKSCKRSHLGSN